MKPFHQLLKEQKTLVIPGVFNAASALLAKNAGFEAMYLSGAGIATGCFGVPDLGITTLDDVYEETERITHVEALHATPLLVDADTGFGDVSLTVKKLEEAGASGIHLEDQVFPKRCGHRPGKEVISSDEMVLKIQNAIKARVNSDFFIIARVDSRNVLGFDDALLRAKKYQEAGADAIFAEALESKDEYKKFALAIKIPVLANMTEFGKTPYISAHEFESLGVRMVIFPLTAFRRMMNATEEVYRTIKKEGTQKPILNHLQTREELYKLLNYYEKEKNVDKSQ
ncbi:MAG: methylisocitrate lyase [Candidatus Melainabacteria bacterium RIFCSPLOWO2_02_FULL_35_15]|nr:MAG: methylisocitrate lyase [Candidatus Melainabacteria bacterium RIFCSPLOWO2_12_FULL_35_11]OGI14886.1 MAG: methylisocitrate lyase [Candidatus Melainabacteria bacterium RIFCSPLOWO2_02_FULL_35_15]